jgi:hypothetical protein
MLEIFCSIRNSGKDRSFLSGDIREKSLLRVSSRIRDRF